MAFLEKIRAVPLPRLASSLIPVGISTATISVVLVTNRWNQWGVEEMQSATPSATSFADLANITLTADCLALGEPIEDCDPYGRPFQPYVVLPARILNFLGLDTATTGVLGILLVAFFIATIAALALFISYRATQPSSYKSNKQLVASQLLLALAAVSPATMLAIERGQIEQLTFFLVVTALLLLSLSGRSSAFVGGVSAVLATVTKYVSVGMFLPFIGATKRFNPIALGALGVSVLYLLIELPNLLQATEASNATEPQTTKSAFGATTMLATLFSGDPLRFDPPSDVVANWSTIRLASFALFILTVGIALMFLRKTKVATSMATTLLLGSGGVLLLPYLAGISHDYRLIFLIAVIAASAALPTSKLSLTLALASTVALITSAAMVPTPQGWLWPTPLLIIGDAALMIVLAAITALWMILLWRGINKNWLRNNLKKAKYKLPDLGIIVAITVFFGLISQRWTGLDTPDSSFYLSLGLFGSEITDRAPIDSYYATRLGHIVPIRALTEIFGTWIGLEFYRLILMGIIIGSAYITVRVFSSRTFSAFASVLVVSSTVVLSYLGNPYVTAPSMAGLSIVIATAVFYRNNQSLLSSIAAGATLGWLAMVNPHAALFAGSIWIAIIIQTTVITRKIKLALTRITQAAICAAFAFLVYLLIGRAIFPDMDWFATYLEWNSKLNYADFASPDPVWLQDISLLVPLASLFLVTWLWWSRRTAIQTQVALITLLTTIGFVLTFDAVMKGHTLEAPFYTSLLWIPSLLSLALATSAYVGEIRPKMAASVTIGIALIIAAGFITTEFSLPTGLLIMLVATTVAALTIPRGGMLLIVGLSLFAVSSQLVQDSRRDVGLYFLSPFSWAYQDNPVRAKIENSVKVQEWVIENTTPDDQILVWVDGDWLAGDRDLFAAAAMQLWGENRNGVDRTLRPEDLQRIQDTQPTAFVLYGPNKVGLQTYALSLPRELRVGELECTTFDWPTLPEQATACITRVRN